MEWADSPSGGGRGRGLGAGRGKGRGRGRAEKGPGRKKKIKPHSTLSYVLDCPPISKSILKSRRPVQSMRPEYVKDPGGLNLPDWSDMEEIYVFEALRLKSKLPGKPGLFDPGKFKVIDCTKESCTFDPCMFAHS